MGIGSSGRSHAKHKSCFGKSETNYNPPGAHENISGKLSNELTMFQVLIDMKLSQRFGKIDNEQGFGYM
jgi:hypothetical protein